MLIFVLSKDHAMGKRKVISEAELKELVLPMGGEVLGRVIKLLGSDHILVRCVDGKTRIGRIRGKLKRKIWVRDNDIVLIAPWEFKREERGDIVWRYTFAQIDWLRTNNYLPEDF
jgi:translation initiation factor 1A